MSFCNRLCAGQFDVLLLIVLSALAATSSIAGERGQESSRSAPQLTLPPEPGDNPTRNPEHPEFQPRTGWSLLNAYTGVLKDRQKSSPQEAALQTIQLQRLLSPPDIIDVEATPVFAG